MRQDQFILMCEDALIEMLGAIYNEHFQRGDFHLVWFSKNLQNRKCVLIDMEANQRYYECTFNGDENELYVDIYEKQHNRAFSYK